MSDEYEEPARSVSFSDGGEALLVADLNPDGVPRRKKHLVITIDGYGDHAVVVAWWENDEHRARIKAFGEALVRWAKTGGL